MKHRLVLLGAAVALLAPGAAVAGEGHAGPGAPPAPHSTGAGGADHVPATPPAEEQPGIHDDAVDADHADEGGHAEETETPARDRPRTLVLGSFAVVNVLILGGAAIVRRRNGRRR